MADLLDLHDRMDRAGVPRKRKLGIWLADFSIDDTVQCN